MISILSQPKERYLTHKGFPTGRDSATFRDKGTEVPLISLTGPDGRIG